MELVIIQSKKQILKAHSMTQLCISNIIYCKNVTFLKVLVTKMKKNYLNDIFFNIIYVNLQK